MALPMVKAALNTKVNFSMLHLISDMVTGSHIKLLQVSYQGTKFVFPFIFPLSLCF